MSDLFWPTIFTLAMLIIGGVSYYGITHWLPKLEPRQPTELDLATEQLRRQLVEVHAEIMRPLLPILHKLATEMTALFPPRSPTFRERLRRRFRR